MEYLVASIALLAVPWLAFLARLVPKGMRGYALHPFNVLGLLITIVVFDFLALAGDTRADFTSTVLGYLITNESQVARGAFFFLLCVIAMVSGITAVTLWREKRRREPTRSNWEQRRSATTIMRAAALCAMIVAFALLSVSISRGSILYVAGIRTSFFRDYQGLSVLLSLCMPAFFLYGSTYGFYKRVITYGVILLLCFIPIGSRGLILFLFVGMAFWASQRWRFPLALAYLAIAPLAIFTALYRYLTRDSSSFDSFAQFIEFHGGYFNVLFRSPDISIAEVITIGVTHDTISRSPWDTLLGVVTAPIPRSLIPWKPLGASSDFTRDANPELFDLVGSERTISGFTNLVIEWGYFGGLISCALLASIWALAWVRTTTPALAGPLLAIIAYTFVRADLYNVARFLWPLAFVLIAHAMLVRLHRQSRRRRGLAQHQRQQGLLR